LKNYETTIDAISTWQRRLMIAGLVGLAVCAVAAVVDFRQFSESYLLGFMCWWTVAIGCLAGLLLGNMTGGHWAAAGRVLFASGAATLPLVAVLFIPIAVPLVEAWINPETTRTVQLYPWAEASAKLLGKFQATYLTPGFFLLRAVIYFAIWCLSAVAFSRKVQPHPETPPRARRSALAGALLVLTASFAAMDWGMSLDPAWYSTIYGALVFVAGVLGAFALVTLLLNAPTTDDPKSPAIEPGVRNDFGNLLLAMVMVWTYFSLSQYLIIWSGNLPSEATWYLERATGGWQLFGALLVVFHFVIPFLLLISRDRKRDPKWLASIAAGLLVMHVADMYWTLAPSFHDHAVVPHWADLAAVVGVAGLGSSAMLWRLKGNVKRLAETEAL